MGKDLFAPAPAAEPATAPADGSAPPADDPSKETTNTVAVATSAGDKE
jgi:hypothetical protein